MEQDNDLIDIALSHKHRVEFNAGTAMLWCQAYIESQEVSAGFKVAGLTEANWPAHKTYLLSLSIPLLYKQRVENKVFTRYDLDIRIEGS